MGALTSRQNAGVEEVDVVPNHAYKYPPRSGNYFGSHFIMGGERFDTPQPEAYLFGENADLNFLGSRPTPFPYPPPQANEPTKTLKSLVNIRKESLRFVRVSDPMAKLSEQPEGEILTKSTQFNIEFTFDCDSRCSITIYYFSTEEFTQNGVIYNPRDSSMNSHTYRYKRGANQQFSQTSHIFDPSKYSDEDLIYNSDKEIFPIAIHCVVEEGSEEIKQSHTTIAVVEKHSDGTYVLKALKQKLYVDGLCYLLQEIYGIENKNVENNKNNGDEDCEDNGSECVICMCAVRDTLILPCRHLCLCNSCADSLRYQANNCPICRAPFRALLQIRALQKQSGQPQPLPASPPDGSSENIPAGYEAVSLIEALNGPCTMRVAIPPTPQSIRQTPATTANATTNNADGDAPTQDTDPLSRCSSERHSAGSIGGNKSKNCTTFKHSKDLEGKSPRDRALAQANTPEFRMSVLLAREEDNGKHIKVAASSPLLVNQRTNPDHSNCHEKNKITMAEDCTTEDLDVETDGPEAELDNEGDSDAEKLSPLLTESEDPVTRNAKSSPNVPANVDQTSNNRIGLHLEAVLEPIDDTDTDEPEQLSSASVGPICAAESEICAPAEDSDYFTPEDTHTTILTSPQHQSKNKQDSVGNNAAISSAESTPHRWAIPHHMTSLPGTPSSHVSNRSSGDSYSSSSSTRQLLTNASIPSNLTNTTVHPLSNIPISQTINADN